MNQFCTLKARKVHKCKTRSPLLQILKGSYRRLTPSYTTRDAFMNQSFASGTTASRGILKIPREAAVLRKVLVKMNLTVDCSMIKATIRAVNFAACGNYRPHFTKITKI